MRVLALDLGMHTGYAIGDGASEPQSGTMHWKGNGFEGAGVAFLRFQEWLRCTVLENRIGRVVFEEVRRHPGGGTKAAHVFGGWLAIVGIICESQEVPYSGVGVGAIKKHATGSGNATKQDMMAAANARGWEPQDDNEADALWLLDLALSMDGSV